MDATALSARATSPHDVPAYVPVFERGLVDGGDWRLIGEVRISGQWEPTQPPHGPDSRWELS